MHPFINRLIHESSPYLQQHAHNPVDWYPWGDEALLKAKQENKPILVSIGYAACHWCHVMERESFENEATAAIMNEHFINIKIDREERPDLDHIYMDAVQAMTGSGGWPLNVFLTPDAKPFYGGTYFPPVRAYNRASWTEILKAVSDAFYNKREEIDTQAENLTAHLLQSNSFGLQNPGAAGDVFSPANVHTAMENLMKTADKEWGGFGRAPKFPQTFSIRFLLRHQYAKNIQRDSILDDNTHDKNEKEAGLRQALLSLDKMIDGGIYDQVGGGFARYSTDTEWLVPHFEKMLYDNALLVSVLSEAFQLTRNEKYSQVIFDTLAFIERELMHPGFGFYSALDADSEGEEGKFYVWQKKEVEEILGNDATLFCAYYDISEHGNWTEGSPPSPKNIPRVLQSLEDFAASHNIDVPELKKLLDDGKAKLLARRAQRPRPLLDDKIILGWNALMNIGYTQAYAATGKEQYRQLAINNMQFILHAFAADNPSVFHHTWKNGKARFPAFLDDYAFLIRALIGLQEVTGDTSWLIKAKEITERVIRDFSEPETGFFYYTPEGQQDVIVRKKELYDSALPSGNSMMASNLYTLSIYFDRPDWKNRALDQVKSLINAITRYPGSFGGWNCLLLEMATGTAEIAILGTEGVAGIHRELLAEYLPHRVLMVSEAENEEFALLAQKIAHSRPAIYVCKNFTCARPVGSVTGVLSLINRA